MRQLWIWTAALGGAALLAPATHADDSKSKRVEPAKSRQQQTQHLREELSALAQLVAAVDPRRGVAMDAFRRVTDGSTTNRLTPREVERAHHQQQRALQLLEATRAGVDDLFDRCSKDGVRSCQLLQVGSLQRQPEELSTGEQPPIGAVIVTLREALHQAREEIVRRSAHIAVAAPVVWRPAPAKPAPSAQTATIEVPAAPAEAPAEQLHPTAGTDCTVASMHFVALTVAASGSAPSAAELGAFMLSCTASEPRVASRCVLGIRELPRPSAARMRPLDRCWSPATR